MVVRIAETRRLILGALVLSAIACEKADQSAKLDDIVTRLDRMEKKVDAIASRPAMPPQMPQRPPEPDSNAVYSVPVDGDPYIGPAVAKVTLVEASDFA
jgi:protein-disulfide isomerase